MIKIRQAVIVEGKYDKIKLSSLLDTVIIETNGFGIYKDKERQQLIRKLAAARGIVILTDSDSAGFQIRSFLGGSLPPGQVVHAYIPDILGKERRKTEPSREGKLGVEGIPTKDILAALRRAGVDCEETEQRGRRIEKLDLFEDGLSGRPDSRIMRSAFLRQLGLPERLSANALVELLNLFMTYEAYKIAVTECRARQA